MNLPFFKKKDHNKHIQSEKDILTKNAEPALSEALKSARTNFIYSTADIEGGKCVMITSPLAAEGKTTTCINLALSLAQTESRVLLIDADLRCPRIHAYMEVKNRTGLTNYLGGFCALEDMIYSSKEYNLDYITAGNIPPNPIELLSSKRMKDLINTLQERYDYILIDTPPVNVVADTAALAKLVPNVIFVCKCGISRINDMHKAITAMKFANAKILGFITIESPKKKKSKSKYYSQYYSKYYRRA